MVEVRSFMWVIDENPVSDGQERDRARPAHVRWSSRRLDSVGAQRRRTMARLVGRCGAREAVSQPDGFLQGRALWREITSAVRESKRTWAAVAYLGKDCARLLPLKPGDLLVVDMTLSAVRHGVTDPREVKKLLNRKVIVCSCARLHAKMIVADAQLFIGSMNASQNAARYLKEAGVATTSKSIVSAARRRIRRWGVEPILPEQLNEALRQYRPPAFFAARTIGRPKQKRGNVQRGRLWILGNLVHGGVPNEESATADRKTKEAARGFARGLRTSIQYIHFPSPSRFVKGVRRGDWIVQVCEGEVFPPARCAGKASYARKQGKRRYLVVTEERDAARTVSRRSFRRALKRVTGQTLSPTRTRPIREETTAERILGCWSPHTGRPLRKYFGSLR
jgi:hypothetical protein